jgi:hypothetical protein
MRGWPGGLYIQNNEKCTSEKVLVDIGRIGKPPDNRDLMSTPRQGGIMHAWSRGAYKEIFAGTYGIAGAVLCGINMEMSWQMRAVGEP